jgi:2-amino-4-hydroxy-6-hydroxymethyldihydropteridine diphosphokinase
LGNKAYIALGSNMESRYDYLLSALQQLQMHPYIQLVNVSSIYETDPVGYEDQDLFLNMVVEINTELDAFELLEACLNIEMKLGRKREFKWGPRTIDLDILLYNQENIESENLIVPHPRIKERAFVIIPLLEINHDLIIPPQGKQLSLWLDELPNQDQKGVRIWKRKNGEDVFVPIES